MSIWTRLLTVALALPIPTGNAPAALAPDEVTTVLDVGPFVDTKIASLNCHRTQIDPNGPFSQLPEDMTRDIMRTEYYTLVLPVAAGRNVDILAALSEAGSSGVNLP